jgi:RNA polymerase sigma factor (sigma-70 family)
VSLEPTRISLLSRIRDPDDDDAWREFEVQYRDLILGYCLRRGLQRDDAEDVLQVVMSSLSTVFRRGFQYSSRRGKFRSYVGRVVANAVARAKSRPRDQLRHLDTEVERALAAPAAGKDDLVWEDEWVQHHFRRAMRTVQRCFEKKTVAMFRELLHGRPVDWVAREYEVSTDTVYKAKQRVRERLEELICSQVAAEEEANVPELD